MKRLTVMTPKGAALKMDDTYPDEGAARADLMRRYRAAVDRLAAYEDTGLEPGEIPERLVPLPPVCYKEDGDGCAYQTYDGTDEPIDECKECPLCCVDKQRHRAEPNPPLTLDELREMDGEPVWINIQGGLWGIAVSAWDGVVFGDMDSARFNRIEGFAYRRKPGEGTT